MKILSEHEDIKWFLGDIPIMSCTIRITNVCNLHCIQCYSKSENDINGRVMTFDEISKLLYDLKDNNVTRLSITGGEPFMRTDMMDILELASGLGFEIYISTNGTLGEINFNRLANIRIKVLQISLDGVGILHDNIRGQRGAFNRSIEFIKKIRNANPKMKIGVAFTLMRMNMNGMIHLFDFLKEIPIDIFSVVPVQRIGRSVEEYSLLPREIKEKLDQIAEHWDKDRNIQLNIMVAPALVPQIIRTNGEYKNGYLCTYPYSIAINAKGQCSLCDGLLDEEKYVIGDITEGIKNVFSGEFVDKVCKIRSSDLKGVCSICKLKDFCAGGCRADSYLETRSLCASDLMCQSYFDEGIFPEEFMEKIG